MRPAPHTVFMWALALFAVCVVSSGWLATRSPWLGVSLTPSAQGLRVTAIAEDGPAAGVLATNDVIVTLQPEGAPALKLEPGHLLENPNRLRGYSELNGFLHESSRIHAALMQTPVSLTLADGRTLKVKPRARRPLSALHWSFWYLVAWSAAGFLVTASVWSFRPDTPVTRYFAISGASLMLTCLTVASYAGAGFGMDGALLEKLLVLEHLFMFVFLAAFVGLCCVYPARLSSEGVVTGAIFCAAGAWWIGDFLQLWPSLDVGYEVAQLAAFVAAALILGRQWRSADAQPRTRWFSFTALGGFGMFVVLYPGALLLTGAPLLDEQLACTFLQMIYVALAIGIYRHGLFQIDRWVWNGWLLFGLSAGLLALDFGLAYALGAQPANVMAASLALLAWLYFPLRQWLWVRLSHRLDHRDYRAVFPALINELLSQQGRRLTAQAWQHILQRLFAPLDVHESATDPAQPRLQKSGVELHLPGAIGLAPLVLSHADRGGRLFSAADERLAEGLMQLVTHMAHLQDAAEVGALRERLRLGADLHDQVMPLLLSLVYRADDTQSAETGRRAIRELRRLMQEMQTVSSVPATVAR